MKAIKQLSYTESKNIDHGCVFSVLYEYLYMLYIIHLYYVCLRFVVLNIYLHTSDSFKYPVTVMCFYYFILHTITMYQSSSAASLQIFSVMFFCRRKYPFWILLGNLLYVCFVCACTYFRRFMTCLVNFLPCFIFMHFDFMLLILFIFFCE